MRSGPRKNANSTFHSMTRMSVTLLRIAFPIPSSVWWRGGWWVMMMMVVVGALHFRLFKGRKAFRWVSQNPLLGKRKPREEAGFHWSRVYRRICRRVIAPAGPRDNPSEPRVGPVAYTRYPVYGAPPATQIGYILSIYYTFSIRKYTAVYWTWLCCDCALNPATSQESDGTPLAALFSGWRRDEKTTSNIRSTILSDNLKFV